jgi:hypothetical protein
MFCILPHSIWSVVMIHKLIDSTFICEKLCRYAHLCGSPRCEWSSVPVPLCWHLTSFVDFGADCWEIKLSIHCLVQADLALSCSGWKRHYWWCKYAKLQNILWCQSTENLLFLARPSTPYPLMKFPRRRHQIMQDDCKRAHRCHWYACLVPVLYYNFHETNTLSNTHAWVFLPPLFIPQPGQRNQVSCRDRIDSISG